MLAYNLAMPSKIYNNISHVSQTNFMFNFFAVAQRGVLFVLALEPTWTKW